MILSRFLLAQLYVILLRGFTNKASIREALKTLPKTLDDAYSVILDRIEQDTNHCHLAYHLLSWLMYVRHPLSMSALRVALWETRVVGTDLTLDISDGVDQLDDQLDDQDIMVSSCAGLVKVVRRGVESKADNVAFFRMSWNPSFIHPCANMHSLRFHPSRILASRSPRPQALPTRGRPCSGLSTTRCACWKKPLAPWKRRHRRIFGSRPSVLGILVP
jgi:hypothetical protein